MLVDTTHMFQCFIFEDIDLMVIMVNMIQNNLTRLTSKQSTSDQLKMVVYVQQVQVFCGIFGIQTILKGNCASEQVFTDIYDFHPHTTITSQADDFLQLFLHFVQRRPMNIKQIFGLSIVFDFALLVQRAFLSIIFHIVSLPSWLHFVLRLVRNGFIQCG